MNNYFKLRDVCMTIPI